MIKINNKVFFVFLFFLIWGGALEAQPSDQDSANIHIVRFINNTLTEIKDFSRDMLASCPFAYEKEGHTYYFESEEMMDRYKMCSDLHKTACEKNKKALSNITQAKLNAEKDFS